MTGPVVAAVFAEVLADWRRDGYLPAVCGEPYPLMPEFRCTHPRHGPDRLHGYDGPFPPPTDGDGLSGPQTAAKPGGSGR